MANDENLKKGNPDTQFKSGREAVENGRKGGIASGKSKRLRKTLADIINSEFDKTVKVNGQEITRKEWAGMRLIRLLMNEETDTKEFMKALEFARDTIGEKPIEKTMSVDVDPEVMAEVEKIVDENIKNY